MLNVTAATLRRTVQRGTGRVASARNSYGQHSSQRPYSTPPGTPPEGLKPVLKSGNWILTGAMMAGFFWALSQKSKEERENKKLRRQLEDVQSERISQAQLLGQAIESKKTVETKLAEETQAREADKQALIEEKARENEEKRKRIEARKAAKQERMEKKKLAKEQATVSSEDKEKDHHHHHDHHKHHHGEKDKEGHHGHHHKEGEDKKEHGHHGHPKSEARKKAEQKVAEEKEAQKGSKTSSMTQVSYATENAPGGGTTGGISAAAEIPVAEPGAEALLSTLTDSSEELISFDSSSNSQDPASHDSTSSAAASSASTSQQSKNEDDDAEEEAPVFPTKYAIVGGGPAAFNAMKEILHVEPDAQILIISEEEHTPYDRSPLSKELMWRKDFEKATDLRFPNWRGDFFDLEYHVPAFYQDESKNITFMKGRKVTDLDAGRHVLTLDDGNSFKYEKCLLAVGTSPRPLDVTLPYTSAISQFKTAEDFLALHHTILDPSTKHVTVIGNDYLASDLVDALTIRAHASSHLKGVAQVFPEKGVLAGVFPTYFAEYLTAKTRQTGVDVNPGVKINSIVETPHADHKLTITLDNDKTIHTDHIVLSLGGSPNTELAKKSYLEIDEITGGIAVNAEFEARTDLYVAGDAASYYDAHLGRRRVEGVDHAEISGKVAGLNMTGKNRPYTYQPIRWGAVAQKTSYQGVGLIDSRLDMVGVWQKGPSTPLVPNENNELVPDPNIPLSTTFEDNNAYERGVIYYMDGPKVVGVMMINVNGQMDVAKRLITFPRQFDDLSRLRTQIYLGSKPREDEEAAPVSL